MPIRDRSIANNPLLKNRRKELRNNPTAAETLLWKQLQRRQLLGKKFRRQYSIGRYIVDFFSAECGIAIELDGAPHFQPWEVEYQAERTKFLTGMGIEIIRFENRLVRQDMESVVQTIRCAIQRREGG